MDSSKEALRRVINATVALPVEEQDLMLSHFKPLTLKKEAYFLEYGKKCDQVAFVASGLLRMFYPTDQGEETTCHFAQPNDIVTSLSSFSSGNPSTENIQAIVATELLVISKTDLDMLYRTVPGIQEFGLKTIERVAMNMEKRMTLFRNNTAEERYQSLLDNSPVLLQTVPLQYLASYLGITPQHLSRLRKTTH